MEKALEAYLGKVEKHLRPLSAPERADIVKEIQSEMEELLAEGKTAEDVTARLGKPDELAKAYLSDLITKNPSFSWKRVLALCAYYSVAGLSGLFVIPVLLVCAPPPLCSAASLRRCWGPSKWWTPCCISAFPACSISASRGLATRCSSLPFASCSGRCSFWLGTPAGGCWSAM